MNITIIGLGLIGGSVALDLAHQLETKVYGYDNNPNHAQEAIRLGLITEIISENQIYACSDVIIIATPVDQITNMLPSILDKIKSTTVVIDLGSTKVNITKAVANHPNRGQFVAAHPLAGTEFSGPGAATKGLFEGKKNIICDAEHAKPEAVNLALRIFKSLGLKTIFMTSTDHDKHLAYVSHLSHISSFVLGLTVLEIEKDEKNIFNLAGSGFESTVRLAKSNPKTWSPIFDNNKDNLLEAIDNYILQLNEFRTAIKMDNLNLLEEKMYKANAIIQILKEK